MQKFIQKQIVYTLILSTRKLIGRSLEIVTKGIVTNYKDANLSIGEEYIVLK